MKNEVVEFYMSCSTVCTYKSKRVMSPRYRVVCTDIVSHVSVQLQMNGAGGGSLFQPFVIMSWEYEASALELSLML